MIDLMVHPLQPHVVAAITSDGLAVMYIGACAVSGLAVLPGEVKPRVLASAADLADHPPSFSMMFAQGASPREVAIGGSDNRSSHPSESGTSDVNSWLPGGGNVAPKDWTVEEVGRWLIEIGLGVHRRVFAEQEIDGRLLLLLTTEDLKTDLGIGSNLQAKRIISKISLLQEQIASSARNRRMDKNRLGDRDDALSGSSTDGSGFRNSNNRLRAADTSMVAQEESRQVFYVANQDFLSRRFVCSSSLPGQVVSQQPLKHMTLRYSGVTRCSFSNSGKYVAVM
eukprot:SAG31_NODE_6018_length_2209_cov_1.239810_3_plen_281_part_01